MDRRSRGGRAARRNALNALLLYMTTIGLLIKISRLYCKITNIEVIFQDNILKLYTYVDECTEDNHLIFIITC